MTDHEQYNLEKKTPENIIPDYTSNGSVIRTDKTFNIKNQFIMDDDQAINRLGQTFGRTEVDTLLTGSVYSASVRDFLIGITSLSYSPSIGLPSPLLVGPGKHFIVKDEVGGAAATTITIRSEGEKLIDGAATATITTNYGSKEFYTNGANWFTK